MVWFIYLCNVIHANKMTDLMTRKQVNIMWFLKKVSHGSSNDNIWTAFCTLNHSHDITEILLKVALNTITPNPHTKSILYFPDDLWKNTIHRLRKTLMFILKTWNTKKWVGKTKVRLVVFNATFNTISVISLRLVLLVEETGVPGENHRAAASHR